MGQLPGAVRHCLQRDTVGREHLDEPLHEISGKGLFTRELDEALLGGRVDLVVHSLKDLPTVLPEGLCYGRVDTTDSAGLVRRYLQGRLDNRFLRGRTSLPHAVQAAQYFAREQTGEDRIDALAPLHVERGDGHILVTLNGKAGPIEVTLEEQLSEPLLSQCHAKVAGQVRVFTCAALAPAAR